MGAKKMISCCGSLLVVICDQEPQASLLLGLLQLTSGHRDELESLGGERPPVFVAFDKRSNIDCTLAARPKNMAVADSVAARVRRRRTGPP